MKHWRIGMAAAIIAAAILTCGGLLPPCTTCAQSGGCALCEGRSLVGAAYADGSVPVEFLGERHEFYAGEFLGETDVLDRTSFNPLTYVVADPAGDDDQICAAVDAGHLMIAWVNSNGYLYYGLSRDGRTWIYSPVPNADRGVKPRLVNLWWGTFRLDFEVPGSDYHWHSYWQDGHGWDPYPWGTPILKPVGYLPLIVGG